MTHHTCSKCGYADAVYPTTLMRAGRIMLERYLCARCYIEVEEALMKESQHWRPPTWAKPG